MEGVEGGVPPPPADAKTIQPTPREDKPDEGQASSTFLKANDEKDDEEVVETDDSVVGSDDLVSPDSDESPLKILQGEERTRHFFVLAGEVISENMEGGKLDREKGELALSYDKNRGVEENSKALRANIEVLRDLPENDVARETLETISGDTRVDLDGEEYSLNDWEERLASVTDPVERAALEEKGIYAFEFPEQPPEQPPEELVTSTESSPETVSDLFSSQKASLQEKIREKEAKGEDISEERTQLTMIGYAEHGAGDNRAYLRRIALKSLGKSGVDVDRFLTKYAKEGEEKSDEQKAEESGKQKIYRGLDRYRGLSEQQAEDILKGSFDIEGLMKNDYEKYSDLPGIIMGRNLSKDEAKEMMNTVLGDEKTKYLAQKYGKNMLFVMLGLLFVSTVGAFEVAKAGSSR